MSIRMRTVLVISICVLASMPGAKAGSSCPTSRFNLWNDSDYAILSITTPPSNHDWLADALKSKSATLKKKVGAELNVAWPKPGDQCVCTQTLRITWAKGKPEDVEDNFCRKIELLIVKPTSHRFRP